jgi:hypothetical protein
MAPTTIYSFIDPFQNIITYNFDPELRDEDGDGAVTLERISRKAEPQDQSIPLHPEPEAGEEFYRYTAEDGGDVRYQYDPGSRNGKDYVVAIHRTPENWGRLLKEDLSVRGVKRKASGKGKNSRGDWTMPKENMDSKRRDSGVRVG